VVTLAIVVGLILSAAVLQFTRGLLFDVEPFDPLSFATAALTVLLCAGLACLIPSWRAVRTNASSALREQ
jgi:putative ABC transport system permease protein